MALITNKPYMFTQLGISAETFLVSGLGAFLPKIVQTQFLMSSSEASMTIGAVVIVGAAGGIIGGGIWSRKWTPQLAARNVAIFALVSLLCSFGLLIHCDPITLAGTSTAYSLTTSPNTNVSMVCNANCSCSDLVYHPLCDGNSGMTYQSVCHAGCRVALSSSEFTNCSCLSSPAAVLTDGKCKSGCNLLPLFLVIVMIFMVFIFMNQVPTTTVTLRSVAERERSMALGFSSVIYRLLGAIPGPLIVGALLDSSCLLWELNVSCMLYAIGYIFCRYMLNCLY